MNGDVALKLCCALFYARDDDIIICCWGDGRGAEKSSEGITMGFIDPSICRLGTIRIDDLGLAKKGLAIVSQWIVESGVVESGKGDFTLF